jgi:hypothetical protein
MIAKINALKRLRESMIYWKSRFLQWMSGVLSKNYSLEMQHLSSGLLVCEMLWSRSIPRCRDYKQLSKT